MCEEQHIRSECTDVFGGQEWLYRSVEKDSKPRNYTGEITNTWYRYKNRRLRNIAETPCLTPVRQNSEEVKGYEGDAEYINLSTESEALQSPASRGLKDDAEAMLHKQLPRFVGSLTNSIQFCVFNTESMTKVNFWSILHKRLSPEILTGVI